MHIYFSGIGGVAIGPLARIARDLGHRVTGSDNVKSRYTESVVQDGIEVIIGQTTKAITQVNARDPIDWFIYTSGLPADHPELLFAKSVGIKTSKRDEFINQILSEKQLKLLAVAGTHGKTNTTAMLVWALKQLGIPVSYSIGSNIIFGANGRYEDDSAYFVYEADEFDRNFLHFKPFAALYTSVDYDHPDTYPTVEEYKQAFADFAEQSAWLTTWGSIAKYVGLEAGPQMFILDDDSGSQDADREIKLMGKLTRNNAWLVLNIIKQVIPELSHDQITDAINSYPGTERRMEKLAENLYSDYAHHPIEIKSAVDAAQELEKSVIAVYQPHQNVRQHEVRDLYQNCFDGCEKVYWLPTYLSREDPNLEVLTPESIVSGLTDPAIVEIAEMNNGLIDKINQHRDEDKTVILLNAGSLDAWARENIVK